MNTVEGIIMRRSARGMDKLLPHLPADYCRGAASSLLGLQRGNVLIATGFYVAGFAETDGPPGAFFLAQALNALGFECTIVTDKYCAGFFDGGGIDTEYIDIDANESKLNCLLRKKQPVSLLSIERCGADETGDYKNMRGVSISSHTARLDHLFLEGMRRGIPTYGIGDGGNEIGMGCFKETIERELSLSPCVTRVDYPIIATVSNWGAYGLCAYLQMLSGESVMPTADEVMNYIAEIAAKGSVDGVTREHSPTVDGFPQQVERETVELLNEICQL